MLPIIESTILVVEDDLLVRLDLTEALTAAGYNVRHARSSSEAIDLLNADASIGVVFADIQLDGDDDGVKLAHVIRETWPRIVIVFSSGRILPSYQLQFPRAKILRKPYDAARLKSALDEVPSELQQMPSAQRSLN